MIYFTRVLPNALKIGYTSDLTSRMARLSSRYGHQVELLAFCEGDRETERYFHSRFHLYRLGRSEHFMLHAEILGFVGHPLLLEMPPGSRIEPVELEAPPRRSVA